MLNHAHDLNHAHVVMDSDLADVDMKWGTMNYYYPRSDGMGMAIFAEMKYSVVCN